MKLATLHQWRPSQIPPHHNFFAPLSLSSSSLTIPTPPKLSASSSLQSKQPQQQQELTARERRKLRNENRESKPNLNWKEQVEERLLEKPKKRYKTKSELLNLDTLADLGPQWWVVRTSRVKGLQTAELLAKVLARNFPELDFKVYAPVVQVKQKLKNGSISVKPKPIFAGNVFLHCLLNREIHDFIRDVEGIGGFVGAKVWTNKRQINKPRPVSEEDMEALFKQAKVEQDDADRAFNEQQQQSKNLGINKLNADSQLVPNDAEGSVADTKPKKESSSPAKKKNKLPVRGSKVKVVSGTFAEYDGILKKLNRKTGKATVGFTLFGKESLVDLDVNEIVAETM